MLGSALRLGGNLILELRERCGTVGGGVLGRQLRPPTNVSRILVALAAKPTRARLTFTGLTPTRYVEVRRRFMRKHPGHALGRLAAAGRLISYRSDISRHANLWHPQS